MIKREGGTGGWAGGWERTRIPLPPRLSMAPSVPAESSFSRAPEPRGSPGTWSRIRGVATPRKDIEFAYRSHLRRVIGGNSAASSLFSK
ncbi:hypothetical protein CgunFtcFv8_017151 [Champsocephalus gunnari]|uniref:Uncharacterized protein n=1 Tax=Champsocephalus gunnari TaxID=52237 RepID=A0AAN8HQF1_CHAGU|nr:hypothetical protein CgunFtcFv8_017151 [Champsocephalus gunnari]